MRSVWAACMAAAIGSFGCDEGADATVAASTRGRAVFTDPDFSGSQFNVFSCATCHPSSPGVAPGPALNLAGAVDRERWWNGEMTSLYDAANFCWRYFMRGFPAIDPADDDARALFEYLDALGTGEPAPTARYTVVEQLVDPGAGDAGEGEAVWDHLCRVCHGDAQTGEGRLGPDVSTVPGASQAIAIELGVDARLVVIEKIRHGQFFGVGGNMPFYPLEVLDADALADLLAFLDP